MRSGRVVVCIISTNIPIIITGVAIEIVVIRGREAAIVGEPPSGFELLPAICRASAVVLVVR